MRRKNRYNTVSLAYAIIYVVLIAVWALSPLLMNAFSGGTATVADGFTIASYNVVLDVGEDDKINVTENIGINFTDAKKHGIYMYIPEWDEYADKDGNTVKRKARITDLCAVGEPYTVNSVNGKKRIIIGDARYYVGTGIKDYVIKYTYDMGQDPFNGFDEFIFNLFGDYWGTPIKNASVQIILPKSVDNLSVNFFSDKGRTYNVDGKANVTVDGNVITATFNGDVHGNCTLAVDLPDGYFKGAGNNYGVISLIFSILAILMTVAIVVLWFIFGKDHAKRAKTVELNAPDNLNAAEVGYVYSKKRNSKKFAVALLLQLASKGYLKIDEVHDAGENIKVTSLIPVPRAPSKFGKAAVRSIEVLKLKDVDNGLSYDEQSVFNKLFGRGNKGIVEFKPTIDVDMDRIWKNKFLNYQDKFVKEGYIQVLSDSNNPAEQKAAEAKYEADKKVFEERMAQMPAISNAERMLFDRLFIGKDEIILGQHASLYSVHQSINDELDRKFKDEIHDKSASKAMVVSIILSIVALCLSFISYVFVYDMNPKISFLYYVAFACIPICLFFTLFMKRRTMYGEEITARVKGFRDYLIKVEKPRLELIVADNPNYFYNILPYAYVLGVSKKWLDKFRTFPIPEFDIGTINLRNIRVYGRIEDSVIVNKFETLHDELNGDMFGDGFGGGSIGIGKFGGRGGGSW